MTQKTDCSYLKCKQVYDQLENSQHFSISASKSLLKQFECCSSCSKRNHSVMAYLVISALEDLNLSVSIHEIMKELDGLSTH